MNYRLFLLLLAALLDPDKRKLIEFYESQIGALRASRPYPFRLPNWPGEAPWAGYYAAKDSAESSISTTGKTKARLKGALHEPKKPSEFLHHTGIDT